jgi:hypothetical protein
MYHARPARATLVWHNARHAHAGRFRRDHLLVLRGGSTAAHRRPAEGRIDTAQLWSDLTPAPVPVVDGDAPATAHAELALALLQMGLVDEARVETQKALSMDAKHAIALRVQAKLAALGR